MGAHHSLPSRELSTQRTLLEIIEHDETLLSRSVSKRFEGKLPFLFKVLSIGKALCIQAHPDKRLAQQLHASDSVTYPGEHGRMISVPIVANIETDNPLRTR
jgi:mannose-6-phosphate isomerase